MQVIHDERDFSGAGSVIALGTFDGVHIGHQRLLRTAVALARERNLQSAVCTFDRHPLALLHPGSEPRALLTLEQKLDKFARLGVDVALVRAFTREFADMSPRGFIQELVSGMRARAVVVGGNYTFGRGGTGSSALLAALAPEMGFEAVVLDAVIDEGEMVSSTLIRRLLQEGDTARASRLLAEPFAAVKE